jgi:hypothetical protein
MARFEALAENLRVVGFGGVGVAADAVAKFAAEHLVYRHVISLARQIPQRHFQGAHASALARRTAELLDLAEDFINVARVLAQNAALQFERIVPV